MAVRRIARPPRVTKPYSERAVGRRSRRCGHQIDAELAAGDVRLTMGGEPTFVADRRSRRRGMEHRGRRPDQAALAADLIRRLAKRFAPGGLLHYGQGKWYPGEQLPRWAFSCYWRKDGEPIWRRPDARSPAATQDHGADARRRRSSSCAARRRGSASSADAVLPALRGPVAFPGGGARAAGEPRRRRRTARGPACARRLARVFEHGPAAPGRLRAAACSAGIGPPRRNGHAPRPLGHRALARRAAASCTSCPAIRPMGYRLPLGSLPHVAATAYPYIVPRGPVRRRADAAAPRRCAEPARQAADGSDAPAARARAAQVPQPLPGEAGEVRTALAVEARDGRLHVFMPPRGRARGLPRPASRPSRTPPAARLPVQLEGYQPPHDPRLNVDQGHARPRRASRSTSTPRRCWREMVANHDRALRGSATRRGSTPRSSCSTAATRAPAAATTSCWAGRRRRTARSCAGPDLLRSLVTYWQHHPSLSYLFSGLFIGPTSQAPRIDEAAAGCLYELEHRLRQRCPSAPASRRALAGRPVVPQSARRRHRQHASRRDLHRQAVFARTADRTAGAGRVPRVRDAAARAHEPARSSSAAGAGRAVLARAVRRRAACAGARQLHDRFMLPHFVLAGLRGRGQRSEPRRLRVRARTWFAPHFEFRFPLWGDGATDGVELELRQALEPWHVLGEEGAIGGTVRYVDSSLERLQVASSGLDGRALRRRLQWPRACR